MFERAAFCDFWRVYRRILFASFLFVAFLVQYSFGDSSVSKASVMNYDCNGGSLVGGYTNPQLADSDSYVILYSGDACTRNGYDFYKWLCTFQNGATLLFYGGESRYITGSNTCMAIWNESCEPGERVYTSVTGLDISPSEQPDVFGYDNFGFSTIGTVSVSGLCSETPGTPEMTGNPSTTLGPNCWCHVVGAQETGGQYNTISDTPWVLLSMSGDCSQDTNGQWVDTNCSYHCAKAASGAPLFVNNLLFTSSCVYPTLTYYNCEQQTGYSNPQPVGGSTQFNGTLASSCIPPSGMVAASNYTFGGWYCVPQGGGDAVSVTGSPSWSYNLTSDTDCYAIWNEVNPCDPGTESGHSVLGVLYDGSLNLKWGPDITFSDLFNPTSVINGGTAENTFTNTNGTSSWTVAWDEGLCSDSAGELYHAGAPNETQNSGDFCWCRVRSVTDGNNETTPLKNYPYVFFGSLSNCTATQCQELCDEVEDGVDPSILSGILEALYTKTMCRYKINWGCNNSEADEPHSYIQSVDAGTTNIATYDGCGVPPNSSFDSWSCETATVPTQPVTVNGSNQIEEMPWDNVNCIASWNSLPTYTLTYVANAPTGVTVSGMPTPNPVTSLPAGATPTLAAGPTATSGYIFDHWDCEDANQNTITITNNSITMPSSNVTCYAQWIQTQYTITYTCGDAGGTMSSNTDTVNIGQASYTVKPNVTGCDSYNGYHFTGWLCTPDLATGTGTATYSNTYPTNPDVSKTIATIGLSGNATCIAQWGQNIVNLLWNDNGATTPHSGPQSDSCLYGPGDITIPTTPPTRIGYSFSGWKVTDWWHRLLDRFTDNVRGTCYCHRRSNNWGYTGDACSSLCYSAPDNTWGLRYHNNDATGIIIGTATCSNQSTTLYTTGDPGATSGQYCWCRVTSYTRGDISEQYNDLPWVYVYDFSSGDCNSSGGCLEKCGSILYNGNTTFQNALFGQ